jgi:hypothetical protein
MARTLLELAQDFSNEVGLTEVTQVIGATDDLTKQIIALANREGKELSEAANGFGGWQSLHTEYTFNTVNGQPNYNLPSDLSFFLDRTMWDGATKWELIGPISAQEKQLLRYAVVASGPRRKFYIRNNQMYIDPTPTVDGDVLAYDYFSKNYVLDQDGVTRKDRFTNDNDTILLDEGCFVMGLKWRFLRAKGLDYAQEKADYETQVQLVIGRDCGQRDLSLVGGTWENRFLDENNIPDTGYGI